jgi:hypothetical protein
MCPLSPKEEFAAVPIWALPPVRNADAWGLFVEWKNNLPAPLTDDDDEESEEP